MFLKTYTMVKKLFPETQQRLFERVFVCKNCKKKMRANPAHVRAGKVVCPKCKRKDFRPKRRPA